MTTVLENRPPRLSLSPPGSTVSDTRYRTALRDALASPTKTNIEALTQAALRAGVLLPLARTRKAHHFLAGEMHLVGEYLRRGGDVRYLPSTSRSLHRTLIMGTMAQVVLGGLPQEDVEAILWALGYKVPRTIWSPHGNDFNEILKPHESVEIYIGYETSKREGRVTLLEVRVGDGRDYRARAYPGFSVRNISEDDYVDIASDQGSIEVDDDVVEEWKREIRSHVVALAKACFYVIQESGPFWTTGTLIFDTPAEVAKHFALEIAMQQRGWL